MSTPDCIHVQLISTRISFLLKKQVRSGPLSPRSPGPEVIKLFPCSTQLSRKFFMLINLNLLTNANSFLLNIADHEIFSANKYELLTFSYLLAEKISFSGALSMKKVL